MADKLIYLPNDDAQIYPLCITFSGLNAWKLNLIKQPINIQSPNMSSQRIRSYKTLGTSVINTLMSPPSLYQNRYNLDTQSLNQPIGKKCRNNSAILLVRKCTGIIMSSFKLIGQFYHA